MPLLDTPDIRQDTPHGCGSGAFHILYRYHFPKKPLPDWGELADPVRGIGPDTLELFVRKEFRNVLSGHIDLATLRFHAARSPVLCLVTTAYELDHWVAVRGVTRDYVYVQDPFDGRGRYTHAEWDAAWRAAVGGVYERFALTGWR